MTLTEHLRTIVDHEHAEQLVEEAAATAAAETTAKGAAVIAAARLAAEDWHLDPTFCGETAEDWHAWLADAVGDPTITVERHDNNPAANIARVVVDLGPIALAATPPATPARREARIGLVTLCPKCETFAPFTGPPSASSPRQVLDAITGALDIAEHPTGSTITRTGTIREMCDGTDRWWPKPAPVPDRYRVIAATSATLTAEELNRAWHDGYRMACTAGIMIVLERRLDDDDEPF